VKLARKIVKLSWTEKALLAEAIGVLAGVRLGLSLFSFQRTARWIVRLPARSDSAGSGFPAAVALATRRASRVVPGATCLVQALTARTLLQRRGLRSNLRIGVARSPDDGFGAHAWLEFAGTTLIGEHSGPYTVINSGNEFS